MNPPYDGNLHLKILSKVLDELDENDEIVNLSPIRWLEDPLAEQKQNSDFKKFENIRNKIKDLDIIKSQEASKIFNIQIFSDLGIYYLIKDGGFNTSDFWEKVRKPIEVIILKKLKNLKNNIFNYIEKDKKDGIRVPLTLIGGNRGYRPVYKELSYVIDGTKNGKHWTECKNMGGYEKPKDCPLPLSIKFASVAEAQNFYDMFFTKFGTWICNITHTQQHLQPTLLPWLDDYTHPWTDEMLYKYFDLTLKEIEMVEKEIC